MMYIPPPRSRLTILFECSPGSCPVAAPPVAPRCNFEALYALSDPAESSRPCFALYPRASDILVDVSDRAASLVWHSKPLSAILPKKVRKYAVADAQHFSTAQPLNPDFARLCGNKAVSNKRWGSVTFTEMQSLEGMSQASLEACSYSLWMMSGLLSQLKRDGFNPSDPTLFNTAISSVSVALSSQARSAAAVSSFLRSKRRESLLAHVTVSVSQVQKRELMVTSGSSEGLFDHGLLERVAVRPRKMRLFLLPCPWRSWPSLGLRVRLAGLLRPGLPILPRVLAPRGTSLPARLASLLVSAPLLLLGVAAVSASRGARVGLLLPNLRVSGSRNHIPV